MLSYSCLDVSQKISTCVKFMGSTKPVGFFLWGARIFVENSPCSSLSDFSPDKIRQTNNATNGAWLNLNSIYSHSKVIDSSRYITAAQMKCSQRTMVWWQKTHSRQERTFIHNCLAHLSKGVCWTTVEVCTRAASEWTASGVGRSDREGHTDNAAD